jgi:hypothetical protein
MDDRQCKICMQHKPLEEFELSGVPGKRFFTCRDCMPLTAPVVPPEFRKLTVPQPVRMCCVDDCDEPATEGHPKCHRHMLEQWAEAEKRIIPKPRSKTICVEKGCNEPRVTTRDGHTYPRCEVHQKEYAAKHNRKARAKNKPPMTEAQQHAGFDRNPDTAASKGDVRKVCIIDRSSDVMIFMEIKITRTCKTGELDMPPLAWQGVTESIAAKGYKIVERGERPEGVGRRV